MRRLLSLLGILALITSFGPTPAHAAVGVFASGGGKKTAGQQFTITVTASGAEFDSLQGTISVSGPVSVVSFTAGGATWLPGKSPSNGGQFVGITSATSSLTVAKITLKGTKEGSGAVSVSGAKLARKGSIVGSDSGSTSFTIGKAVTPPGGVKVTSSTHPDQNQAYAATTVDLSWDKGSGVTGFSYIFNESDNTTPEQKVTSSNTSTKIEGVAVGTHYFHIRAQNADGWGSTTHFKVQVKEPDAVVDESVTKPVITSIEKASDFKTDLDAGTATGIVFKGTGPTGGYKMNLTLVPAPTLPEGTTLSVDISEDGSWILPITVPMNAGFYKATAQAQKEKVLSPASEMVKFDLSLARGGRITILSDKDAIGYSDPTAIVQGRKLPSTKTMLIALIGLLIIAGGAATGMMYRKKRSLMSAFTDSPITKKSKKL